jgi:hypothetical protein
VNEQPNQIVEAVELIRSLRGKQCWYVSCGGAAGSTFKLAFGDRIPRIAPLLNTAHSEEFRRFEGEANLLVWCTWRLDASTAPLTSSDDMLEHVVPALESLANTVAVDVAVELPSWDLRIGFTNGHVLHVFCDHMRGQPSFDGNWELSLVDKIVLIGDGKRDITDFKV